MMAFWSEYGKDTVKFAAALASLFSIVFVFANIIISSYNWLTHVKPEHDIILSLGFTT